MRGKEKRAYEELGRVIRDKNRVERKQRGLDRMIQRMKKIDSVKSRKPKEKRITRPQCPTCGGVHTGECTVC
jgi:uncharacterized coiled-coil protein SlyX